MKNMLQTISHLKCSLEIISRKKKNFSKNKNILVKAIESNKRYEKEIQKLKMDELKLTQKASAYIKKIDYKEAQLKQQKEEIEELKQKQERIKEINKSIDLIVEKQNFDLLAEKQTLVNETITDRESRATRSKMFTDSERNATSKLESINVNKSVALPSLNSSRLKSELSK